MKKTPLTEVWQRFSKSWIALLSLEVIFFLTLLAVVVTVLNIRGSFWPVDPNLTNLEQKLCSPSSIHWLGTDHLGRDVFSRIIHGTPISLSVGFTAMFVSLLIGVTVGSIAGYCGGKVDQILMRSVDALLCFPTFFLILTAVALVGPSLWNIIIVIGLISWTSTARLVRGEFLVLREAEYVHAARVLGQHWIQLILRHILPNTGGVILITAILGIPDAILAEAGLSFLGFGVQPPQATWGNIIADGKIYLLDAWWLLLFPGIAILITALAFYLVGDGLRAALESRTSKN